jgi:hypothetical protein
MSESFNAYREQYLRRHENPVNSALHTVAVVVDAAGLAAALVTRRARVGVIGSTVAFAIGTVGHLFFQPGTLRDDLAWIHRRAWPSGAGAGDLDCRGCGHAVAAGLPSFSCWCFGRAFRRMDQAGADSGGLYPMVLCHNVSQC